MAKAEDLKSLVAEDLKSLIKTRFGSVRKLSETVKISENTINTHLRDGNWDVNQACKLIKALNIPKSMVYLYFFEKKLAEV